MVQCALVYFTDGNAYTDDADIECLSEDHWLKVNPIDIEPMKNEFGWNPQTLDEGVKEYMRHLHECQEKSLILA